MVPHYLSVRCLTPKSNLMCLILFAFKAHAEYPLVVAANRDEAYARPAAPAAFWHDHPQVYGGRDLEMGGAWLGLTRSGRFAAVTNFRDGYPKGVAPRSRGELVGGYLTSTLSAQPYLQAVSLRQSEYAGFGTIAGDGDGLWFLSNYGHGVEAVAPGVHGLSNHLLNTPWPKVTEGKRELASLLNANADGLAENLFAMLADRAIAAANTLPDTGVGVQREKQLGPKFIAVDDRYGTRASTVIIVNRRGDVHYAERSFGGHGKFLGEVAQRFSLTA
jgi:uncharacterized protein with NRDE domain